MPNPGRGQEVLRRRTLAFLQNCWSLYWNKERSIQSKTKEYIYLRNKNLHMLTSVNLTLQYAIRVWHHEGGALAGIGAGGMRRMRDATRSFARVRTTHISDSGKLEGKSLLCEAMPYLHGNAVKIANKCSFWHSNRSNPPLGAHFSQKCANGEIISWK